MVKKEEREPLKFTIELKRKWIIWLVVYLALIIFSPVIFSKISTWISFDASSGVIGDTIGGITAPFINLLAAFLVYLSFKAQIRANQQLNKENEFNYIVNLFNLVKTDFGDRNRIQFKRHEVSNLKYIWDWMLSYEDRGRFIGNLNLSYKTDPTPYDERFRKAEINNRVREPFQVVRSQLFTIKDLMGEIRKSNLEDGLKTFYRFQIERMLFEMDLWLLLNPAFLQRLEPLEIFEGLEIQAAYRDCKTMAKVVKGMGYTVRSALG
ncbi:hypothetical protein AB1A65_06280 [Muricauda sp. ANG21]|uniref:hypothetical protein n=1 Tax=Allomuricauda sp. ANG21 TaxID=3042468 RepID=UPI003454C80E